MGNKIVVSEKIVKDENIQPASPSPTFKPYVALSKTDSNDFLLEVIDGFIRGSVKVEFVRQFRDSGNLVVELKRIPAPTVNTYFSMTIPSIGTLPHFLIVKVLENLKVVSETKVSFY